MSEQQVSAGQEQEEQEVAEILSGQELSGVALQDAVQSLVERQPEKLLDWLENDADSKEILRIAEGTNIPILERWVAYLTTVAGFVNAASFLRLMTWLIALPIRQAFDRNIGNRSVYMDKGNGLEAANAPTNGNVFF